MRTPQEYSGRFADAEEVVKSAFAAITAQLTRRWSPAAVPRPPVCEQLGSCPPRIGRYVVEQVLGRGGFAIVYLAHNPTLERRVALKVLRLSKPDGILRFQQEAKYAAKLEHSGLVTVYDVGGEGDQAFIVQQYIPGQNLAASESTAVRSLATKRQSG